MNCSTASKSFSGAGSSTSSLSASCWRAYTSHHATRSNIAPSETQNLTGSPVYNYSRFCTSVAKEAMRGILRRWMGICLICWCMVVLLFWSCVGCDSQTSASLSRTWTQRLLATSFLQLADAAFVSCLRCAWNFCVPLSTHCIRCAAHMNQATEIATGLRPHCWFSSGHWGSLRFSHTVFDNPKFSSMIFFRSDLSGPDATNTRSVR